MKSKSKETRKNKNGNGNKPSDLTLPASNQKLSQALPSDMIDSLRYYMTMHLEQDESSSEKPSGNENGDEPKPLNELKASEASEMQTVSETPEIPEALEAPEVQEVPEVSEVLEAQGTSEALETSEIQEVPEAPVTPEAQEVSEVSVTPEVQKVSEVLEVQKATQVLEVPEVQKPPQVLEAPVVQKAPQVLEAPVVQKAPQVFEAPVVQKAPQVFEAPVVQKAPQIFEAPVVQKAPQIFEAPAVQKVFKEAKKVSIAPLTLSKSSHPSQTFPSEVIDSLRYLLTRLERSNSVPDRLAIVSASRQEGTSYICHALANVMADDLDISVIVVELNWLWPSSQSQSGGLATVLKNESELKDVIIPTEQPNLFLLPAGRLSKSDVPSMARSKRLREVISELSSRYDRLILDVPAVLATSDAIPLASLGDACCVVVRQGSAQVSDVRNALDEIDHLPILGVIMNQVRVKTPNLIMRLIPQK